MLGRRLPALLLALLAMAALGYAVTLEVPKRKAIGPNSGIFWSDEATYHSMAYSLAFDADLRYERHDLERVYAAGYGGGPSGLFLVRNPDDDGLYFAKAYAYSAAAAPFVRLFGDNGFFVLHAVLLGLMLAAGASYAARATSREHAALYAVTYVLGSVATLYFFWLTPEWFNLALLFLATYLWLYKEPIPGAASARAPARWLARGWTDFAAAAMYGIAIYSKPPNILLVAPLLLWTVWQARLLRAVALGITVAAVVGLLFGGTWMAIGDWNYQGGDRKSFDVLTSYPYMAPEHTFDSVGHTMTTAVSDLTEIPPAATLTRDLFYVWVGRNGGLVVYMFPAIAVLLAFAAGPTRRWSSPHALLAAFWLVQIAAIAIIVKGNWIGGGGTVGSRYFVNSYAILFFALPAGIGLLGAVLSWLVWSLFLAQIVTTPFATSLNPSGHTKRLPYTLLPTELTILNNLPFNTNPRARRQAMDSPPTFFAYFLDDNTWLREGDLGGYWVKGGREAEMILRTTSPPAQLRIEIRNRGTVNRVIVRHAGRRVERRLAPDEHLVIELDATAAHEYLGSYLYRFSVLSEASTIPLFDSPGSTDARSLGVFVKPSVQPAMPLNP